jgi:branched-chain amino acid transport system ATP-binding protein
MSAPILDVRGVTKRFAGLVANDDVSFSVHEGEIVSIIGPNGAGKSTLFGCITGFHKPNAGTVTWRGRDITGYKADRICRLGIARTFQIVQVIGDMTVLENVMTGAFLHAPARGGGGGRVEGGGWREKTFNKPRRP